MQVHFYTLLNQITKPDKPSKYAQNVLVMLFTIFACLDSILGKKSQLKVWSSIGRGCPEK